MPSLVASIGLFSLDAHIVASIALKATICDRQPRRSVLDAVTLNLLAVSDRSERAHAQLKRSEEDAAARLAGRRQQAAPALPGAKHRWAQDWRTVSRSPAGSGTTASAAEPFLPVSAETFVMQLRTWLHDTWTNRSNFGDRTSCRRQPEPGRGRGSASLRRGGGHRKNKRGALGRHPFPVALPRGARRRCAAHRRPNCIATRWVYRRSARLGSSSLTNRHQG